MNMNFVSSNQMLNPDLIQLLLANQAANVNLFNPLLLGTAPILAPLTTPLMQAPLPLPPQQFQFLQPLPPIPSTPILPPISTPLPPTPHLFPMTPKVEEPTIKSEPCDHQPSTSGTESLIPFEMGSIPTSTYYPTHFMRGTQLHVANGDVKKVEDLSSDDFLKCAAESDDVIVNASIVREIRINSGSVTIVFETGLERQRVPLKCQIEHPFFVLGKGWSSCNPRKSGENYGLDCQLLEIGNVCVVLTRKEDERTDCAVDIVTAERDLELFSQRAALREELVEVYYQHVSGRVSAPPERILSNPPVSSRERRISE